MIEIMTKQELLESRKGAPTYGHATKYPRTQTTNKELCKKRNDEFERRMIKELIGGDYE